MPGDNNGLPADIVSCCACSWTESNVIGERGSSCGRTPQTLLHLINYHEMFAGSDVPGSLLLINITNGNFSRPNNAFLTSVDKKHNAILHRMPR